jgi:Domain of unknown function (DUF4157)
MHQRIRTQAKAQTPSAPMQQAFQSRSFPTDPRQAQATPDWKTAGQFGHSFGAVAVHQSAPLIVQPKLKIDPAKDKYEEEADRVAAHVVGGLGMPAPQRRERDGRNVRRKLVIQPMSAFPAALAVTPSVEAGIEQVQGGGQPLAGSVRTPMERVFGADFSQVRIHTDAQSDAINKAIQARAFTTGRDIFFRYGEYNPNTAAGQEVLAHELTHVMQQEAQGPNDDTLEQTTLNLEPELASVVIQRLMLYRGSKTAPDVGVMDVQPGTDLGYDVIEELLRWAEYNLKMGYTTDKDFEGELIVLNQIISKLRQRKDEAMILTNTLIKRATELPVQAATLDRLVKDALPWHANLRASEADKALVIYSNLKAEVRAQVPLEITNAIRLNLYSQYKSKDDQGPGEFGEDYRMRNDADWVFHVHRSKNGKIKVATVQARSSVGKTGVTRAMTFGGKAENIPGIDPVKVKPKIPKARRPDGSLVKNPTWMNE